MLKKTLFPLLVTILFFGCKPTQVINLPEQTIVVEDPNKMPERPTYNPSNTRTHDLLHTKLAVKFNWEKSYLYGQAELTLTPYFYSTNMLVLDARGMDINKVGLMDSTTVSELNYTYDSLLITITLDKEYTRKDTFKIYIDYTAKPDELAKGGSSAIREDKGLYFINPRGEDKEKPQQIWTQGETQASSAWFPTIDAPNERCTDEIAITVAEKYKTLSNGVLTHQELNGDGTRTDFWEQDLPHAPYLFMMTVGDFDVTKDSWRGIDVDYYVEHKYAPDAKAIFGLTTEMLEFYSEVLGVDYPWQKYSQVVVRDYVSGAMENTSAVIHGGFLQQTQREMIDGNNEDIIAHELFHHWFGDLVTCESWANLPLNESFATYGEYLWFEHKHGKDKADHTLQTDLSNYLHESKNKQKDLVRFDYDNKEDMFDAHTYQKGGRVMHMLRNYVGDEAFFASLKKYLTDHQYSDVEMHELRIAFEDVTGEDLNWFFNQWFYSAGHPILDINYEYNDSLKTQTVSIDQMQDLKTTPIYKLPIKIDIYVDGKKETKSVVVDKVMNYFSFKVESKPDLVNVDADKILLCEKVDNKKEIAEWAFLYYNAPKYLDRYEGIRKLAKSNDELALKTVVDALSDQYNNIRKLAIRSLQNVVKTDLAEAAKTKLLDIAKNDKDSKTRGDAISVLAKYFAKDEKAKEIFVDGVSEQSYYVISKSLHALGETNEEDAIKFSKSLEQDKNSRIINAISSIYAKHGNAEQNEYFIKASKELSGYNKYGFIQSYTKYLKNQDEDVVAKGLPILTDVAKNESAWWMRMTGINALVDLEEMYKNKIHLKESELKKVTLGSSEEVEIRASLDKGKAQVKEIEKILVEIKATEKNSKLRQLLGLK